MLWNQLNSLFPDIRFTRELEKDNQIAFLDILLTREESGRLATSVYRKPTTTERVLAFDSNHSIRHKIFCIRTLWDRVQKHCNSETAMYHERRHLHNVFQLNGYTRNVVRQYVKRRPANPTTANTSQNDQSSRCSMPYIKGVLVCTARILGRHRIQVGCKPCKTLRQLLMQPKDPLPHALRSDVVYRVDCKGCNAYYVRETRKTLQSRKREQLVLLLALSRVTVPPPQLLPVNHTFLTLTRTTL